MAKRNLCCSRGNCNSSPANCKWGPPLYHIPRGRGAPNVQYTTSFAAAEADLQLETCNASLHPCGAAVKHCSITGTLSKANCCNAKELLLQTVAVHTCTLLQCHAELRTPPHHCSADCKSHWAKHCFSLSSWHFPVPQACSRDYKVHAPSSASSSASSSDPTLLCCASITTSNISCLFGRLARLQLQVVLQGFFPAAVEAA